MAHQRERYREERYPYARYPEEPFSPWRPSVWHLWLAVPVAVAVAVVLGFYVAL